MNSCATVKPALEQTTITIIGTFHAGHRELNHYSPIKLKELLAQSRPEVLALEIRPHDYLKGDSSKNPWDMNEIVIPFGKENHLPLEPIDWWPDDMRAGHNKFLDELKKTPEGMKTFSEIEDEWAPHRKEFPDYRDVTPEYVHSNEFAKRDSDFRSRITSKIGEGPQNLMWYTRAAMMNQNIQKVLDKFPGKRITIVVGAFHRADIEKFEFVPDKNFIGYKWKVN